VWGIAGAVKALEGSAILHYLPRGFWQADDPALLNKSGTVTGRGWGVHLNLMDFCVIVLAVIVGSFLNELVAALWCAFWEWVS